MRPMILHAGPSWRDLLKEAGGVIDAAGGAAGGPSATYLAHLKKLKLSFARADLGGGKAPPGVAEQVTDARARMEELLTMGRKQA